MPTPQEIIAAASAEIVGATERAKAAVTARQAAEERASAAQQRAIAAAAAVDDAKTAAAAAQRAAADAGAEVLLAKQHEDAEEEAAAAIVAAANERIRQATELLTPPPAPVPPPAPEPSPPPPAPPPAPPAPPPAARPPDVSLSIAGDVNVFADWLPASRYQRSEDPEDGADVKVRAIRTPDGNPRPFKGLQYGLTADGVVVATAAAGGAAEITFKPTLAPGWHLLDVLGPERTVPYVANAPGDAPRPWLPVVSNSHVWEASGGRFHIRWVPAVWKPTVLPITLRPASKAIDTAPPRRPALFEQWLVPQRTDDVNRPRMFRGQMFCDGYEPYFADHAEAAIPVLPAIDGPRGVGTVTMPTHFVFGHDGGGYFCEGTRFGHVSATGYVRTIVGYRHSVDACPEMSAPHAPPVVPELVGDWSAIPVERRGLHGVWGFAWDHRTTVIDETATPVEVAPGVFRQPHKVPPTGFIADTQNNRVLRVENSPTMPLAPAKVFEHITGLGDPWDPVCVDGVLYVTERLAHRISAWDATTGKMLRIVAQGVGALGTVSSNRKPILTPALATARQQPCVLPEGLYYQDGWLYFGSYGIKEIRRVRADATLAPRSAVETVLDLTSAAYLDDNSRFVKLAVSDGTFGPRGMVAFVSWSAMNLGRPGYGISLTGDGPGMKWLVNGYGSAVAISEGRMAWGASGEGIGIITKALPTDTTVRSANRALGEKGSPEWEGYLDWHELGLDLKHGYGGFGFFGEPLPWGQVSADVDAFLARQGHSRPV